MGALIFWLNCAHSTILLSPFMLLALWSQSIYPLCGYCSHIKGRKTEKGRGTSHISLIGKEKAFPEDFVLVYFGFNRVGQNCFTWTPLVSRETGKVKYLIFQPLLNENRQGKGERFSNENLVSQQCLLQERNSCSQRETKKVGLLSWPPPAFSTYILATVQFLFFQTVSRMICLKTQSNHSLPCLKTLSWICSSFWRERLKSLYNYLPKAFLYLSTSKTNRSDIAS